jgi:hypothetical protein
MHMIMQKFGRPCCSLSDDFSVIRPEWYDREFGRNLRHSREGGNPERPSSFIDASPLS